MNTSLFKLLSVTCILYFCAGCDVCENAFVALSPREPAKMVASTVQEMEADSSTVEAAPPRAVPIYSRDVAPLLDRYCLQCHDNAAAQGRIVLDVFGDGPPDPKYRSLLLRVADNLRTENMPPDGEPRPNDEELETINSWLDIALLANNPSPGRVAIRRLNRAEYNNTIRDLFGLDLHPADEFPSDDVGYGFDNIGEVLSTPPILLEMYMNAADRVIGEAFRSVEVRQFITNLGVDTVPRVFRKIKPAVRVFREDKVFLPPTPRPEDPELKKEQRLYNILRAFADRAFRRPATHDELTRLLNIVLSAEKDGEPSESALELALRAVLVSPQFLFLQLEPDRGSGSARNPVAINDFDLASRLSYFLWSSMPDDPTTCRKA
jgi:Protein of unknown function (DUF1587)/Protein of unknown function (DUF1595)/Protein of unknown function (DUF1592)